MSPLQAQSERETTKSSRKAQTLLRTAVLLRTSARWARRTTGSVPATSSSSATAVVVLFDVSFFVCVLALLADAKDGEESVEESASAAEEAEKEE
jgi:hypothetical protein